MTKTYDIIRVRFRTQEAGLVVNGQTTVAKYGRPKRILKVTESTNYQVTNGNNSKEKTKEVVYYTSLIKGSKIKIDPSTFITEWVKGPTPMPKPLRKYNNEQLLAMNYTYEQIREIRGRTYNAKDAKRMRNKMRKLEGHEKCSYDNARSLLDEYGSVGNAFNQPEVKALIEKKATNKQFKKKQKPKVKRGSRAEMQRKLELLRQKYIFELKAARKAGLLHPVNEPKEEPVKVETT